MTTLQPEIRDAYNALERRQRINTGKVASALVVFLMPAGVILDYFVYERQAGYFLMVRLACSAFAGLLWFLHTTSIAQSHYRVLNLSIPLIPAAAIAWMIYETEGPASPYYAGLNLILLAVSAVVHWNILESFLVVGVVLVLYLCACGAQKGPITEVGTYVNNLYFLVLTGIIVVTGNSLFNRLRFREFMLTYELERNKKQLEESNRMLGETNQKLTELDQIKGRFFANISHELRTPLTLMLSPLDALLHRFGRALDDEAQSVLLTIRGNGLRLLKLINDLLDLVRLDSGVMKTRREPVPLAEFLTGLVSAARQLAEDKRIRLESHVQDDVGTVLVDRDKLEKIVLNLQFNALKFTPPNGRVEIRARKDRAELVIDVVDTGMGISEKNLHNVFNRFWQADSSSKRRYQGVGIGLALVKELVEIQNGKVSVQSKEGIGTTFTVRLPFLQQDQSMLLAETAAAEAPGVAGIGMPVMAAQSVGAVANEEWLANLYRRAEFFPSSVAAQDTGAPAEVARNGDHPTILIADDEPDMLRFLKSQLGTHYHIIEAIDGQQAVDKATQMQPEIVLLDMMMPEKDGLQACRELREQAATRSMPIILLTARADEETKLAALSAGASDFLPKPFSTTELHVRVKNLVESHQLQRGLARQNQRLEDAIEQIKDTESQLVQSEKLASLGRLSAGIIHEINNPLNFATTGLFTLRAKSRLLAAEQQEDYNEILKDVEDGINRVKVIVSDLRTFTHPGASVALDNVEVADTVNSALRFLSQECGDRVVIQAKLPEKQMVWANKNKLIQVLINLLQNSLDALKRKEFKDERPTIVITGRMERDKSFLTVRDNGEGIDASIIDKVFDPFFTTKDVGEGMGLGLSICYRIVQEFEGRIAVTSKLGEFSEFTLEFPAEAPISLKQP
jgi:signal transduction histidine kinase